MELILERSYIAGLPTNGNLLYENQLICHTLELPWLNNAKDVSCIPEGRYKLYRCYSKKFDWHIGIKDVVNRKFITLHPANNALQELRGCIAPVCETLRRGVGIGSKEALKKINELLLPEFRKANSIYLTIKPSKSSLL